MQGRIPGWSAVVGCPRAVLGSFSQISGATGVRAKAKQSQDSQRAVWQRQRQPTGHPADRAAVPATLRAPATAARPGSPAHGRFPGGARAAATPGTGAITAPARRPTPSVTRCRLLRSADRSPDRRRSPSPERTAATPRDQHPFRSRSPDLAGRGLPARTPAAPGASRSGAHIPPAPRRCPHRMRWTRAATVFIARVPGKRTVTSPMRPLDGGLVQQTQNP